MLVTSRNCAEIQGGIKALPATDLLRTVSTHSDPPACYKHEKYYCTFVPADCSNCVRYKMEKYCVWFDILVSDKVIQSDDLRDVYVCFHK